MRALPRVGGFRDQVRVRISRSSYRSTIDNGLVNRSLDTDMRRYTTSSFSPQFSLDEAGLCNIEGITVGILKPN